MPALSFKRWFSKRAYFPEIPPWETDTHFITAGLDEINQIAGLQLVRFNWEWFVSIPHDAENVRSIEFGYDFINRNQGEYFAVCWSFAQRRHCFFDPPHDLMHVSYIRDVYLDLLENYDPHVVLGSGWPSDVCNGGWRTHFDAPPTKHLGE